MIAKPRHSGPSDDGLRAEASSACRPRCTIGPVSIFFGVPAVPGCVNMKTYGEQDCRAVPLPCRLGNSPIYRGPVFVRWSDVTDAGSV